MKKIASLIIAIALLLAPAVSYATASSLTQAFKCYGLTSSVCVMTLTWTANSTNGGFTSTALTTTNVDKLRDYYLYEIETDNVTTAPTNLYDITLTNSRGYDLLGGAGADRTSNSPTMTFPKINSGNGFPTVDDGVYTLNITGNSVNSATGVIRLRFVK